MRQNDEDFIRDTLLEKTGRDAYCKGIKMENLKLNKTNKKGGILVDKNQHSKNKKVIEISYSWGDEETPVDVPENIDAFDFMLELALKEMKIEMREHPGEGFACMRAEENFIELKYCDGESCYYKISEQA